jgi:hypothetical protein
MIDYVKITINNSHLHERLLKEQPGDVSDLTFERGRDRYTSHKYRDLLFTLHDSGRVELSGSLHKYWNQGVHNWNDFTRVDLWDTIHDLCQWLQIEPREGELHNIEFGVNLQLPFSPPELLRDLIAYKSYSFGRVSVPQGGTYYQAKNFDCFVKCYDKGAQYRRPDHLLRFEVKVKSMRYLHGANVRTLHDLLSGSNLAVLGAMLCEAWDFVLIRERLPATDLTAKERKVVETVTTTDLKTIDRKRRHELVRKYQSLVERILHGNGTPPNRKNVIAGLIREKWECLTKGDVCNDLQMLTNIDIYGRLQSSSIVCKRPGKVPPEPAPTPPPLPPSAPIVRRCKTTGIDITNQRRDSVFIGEKKVEERPDEVKMKIGPRRRNRRKRTHHLETYYTAHHARNDDSNPRNNLNRRLRRILSQPCLFDPWEVIRLNPAQKAILDSRNSTPEHGAGV